MKKPNLFNYATSELSQDAFLCWILSWAQPEAIGYNKEMNNIAKSLLQLFFSKHKMKLPNEVKELLIEKQSENIDILILINDNIAIPIEDKLHIREHSDQLSRYKKILNSKYHRDILLPIYLQTGEQGDYKEVLKDGYQPVLRKELLEILKSEKTQNNILNDYIEFLENIEKDVNSFINLRIEKWDKKSNPWKGFFNYLLTVIKDKNAKWEYVSNPQKGFLCLQWGYRYNEKDKCGLKLQIEEGKFCFKIEVDNKKLRSDLRSKWSFNIIKAAEHSEIKVRKPYRFGSGQIMTIAIIDGDYRQKNANGKINLDKTIEVIEEAERILDKAIINLNKEKIDIGKKNI